LAVNLSKNSNIRHAEGKLGIVIPGIGAVSTTLMAGVFLCRKGLSVPKGSLTQMGKIKLKSESGTGNRYVNIRDFVPLAKLDDVEFAGWDVFPDTAYEAASKAQVLSRDDIDKVKDELSAIKPWRRYSSMNTRKS
jgi:myo-inositol-1-phosphate synthase